MKRVLRFFTTKNFSLVDVGVGAACVALLEADHIAGAVIALVVGAVVSTVLQAVAK